jgi:hypothetical protein
MEDLILLQDEENQRCEVNSREIATWEVILAIQGPSALMSLAL